jgi:hypothetical protein
MNARHTSIGLVCAALGGLALGACFTGQDARGLPCTADVHCGLGQQCIEGYCEGVFACPEGTEIPVEAVCDGVFDCENGNDEHPDVCDTDAFFCDDGTTIPLEQACDGTAQCADGSDESPDLCILDECSDPAEAYAFNEVPPIAGVDDPLGVFPANVVGELPNELIVAGREGTLVKVIVFGSQGPSEFMLPGDTDGTNNPYFTSPIIDVIVYDFDANGIDDIIVRTNEHKLYAYIGSPDPTVMPEQLFVYDAMGDLQPYYQVPVPIVDIAVGKLNNDSFVDVVFATESGAIFTALGNPDSLDNNEAPFDFSLMNTTAVADAVQVELANLDDTGLDELLVLSANGSSGSLTVGRAKDGGVLTDFWELGLAAPLPFVPSEIVAGHIDNTLGMDLAALRSNGELAVWVQSNPGMFEFGTPSIDLGSPSSGLVLVDFDCNGTEDPVVSVESPPSVRVQFAANSGLIDPARTLTIESEGVPRGKVGALKLDLDGSWDVFHAVNEGTTLDAPQVFGFLTETVAP